MSFRARVEDSQGNVATQDVDVHIASPTGFPSAYALNRPLLQNNPGALLGGDDWQSYASSVEVCKQFNHHGGWGTTPCQCGTVKLVSDGVFGRVPQAQHNDGSSGCKPNEVRYSKGFTDASRHRAWLRITHLCEAGYDSNTFWKFLWAGSASGVPVRHLALTSSGGFTVDFERFGGSESNLPGAPGGGDPRYIGKPNSMISDQEWWEYVYCIEWVTSSHYRVRGWARPLTADNGQTISVPVPGSPRDYPRKVGLQSVGARKPGGYALNRIWLGQTRNDPTSPGHTNFFRWGPWEVIDADVISDPYGLGNDMLT